jgi:predicted porin
MNKSLVAAAALMVIVGAAHAQSSVTLYGIADGGVSYVTGQNAAKKRLVSGIMEGSRFGFRGSEDIGGGYRAIFTLENRFELDTGALGNRPPSGTQLPARFTSATALGLPGALQPAVTSVAAQIAQQSLGVNVSGKFFDRQAFVGLVTPVGAVLLGRQYTPAYELHAAFDIMKTESSLAFGQVATFPPSLEIRTDNAVAYRIQAGAFSASAMVAAGEGTGTTGHLVSAMGMYRTPAFGVGLGYASRENENGEKALTNVVVGASLGIGPGTLSAEFIDIKDDHPGGLTPIQTALASPPPAGVGSAATAALIANAFRAAFRQDAQAYHVGYRFTVGSHTISTAYSRYDDKLARNADVQSYGVHYGYSLSKRTDINLVVTHFDNSANAQSAPGQAGFLGGFTSAPGKDSDSIALGIRHRF